MINTSYSVMIPGSGAISVGVIFPGSDTPVAVPVPEEFFSYPVAKKETALDSDNVITEYEFPDPLKGVGVYCRITYRQAPIPILDWTPSYRTYQPLCVTSAGRWYPSDSEPAEIT
jgi:hypothetical protein